MLEKKILDFKKFKNKLSIKINSAYRQLNRFDYEYNCDNEDYDCDDNHYYYDGYDDYNDDYDFENLYGHRSVALHSSPIR